MNPIVLALLRQLLVSVAITAIGYALLPKPKAEKSAALKDMDAPTAEAGRPIPIVFGQIWIKSPNELAWHDKTTQTETVS